MSKLRLLSNRILVRGGELPEKFHGTDIFRVPAKRTATTTCKIEQVGPGCKELTQDDVGWWCQLRDMPVNDIHDNPLDAGQWIAREDRIHPPCLFKPDDDE